MANSRSLQQAVRCALALATASAAVTSANAQTAPAQPAEATAAPLAEVVVTGSRLKTPNETSISPITSVSATDVQVTGLTRVEDVLNNLPMVFAGQNTTTSNGADGTATVDLRGFGNQRTLVLVNGLRLGPGSAIGGRNFSDINQIPASLIERVDVLTGGASAVYGADAVAGVVNFVLNTHFEGVRIDAGYHYNQHHNGDQDSVDWVVNRSGFDLPPSNVNTAFGKTVSVLMGSNFADNKGNATAYLTYDNQGYALQNRYDYAGCSLGTAGKNRVVCAGSGTSAKNGAGGKFYVSTPGGSSFIINTVDGKTGQFRPFATSDNYNFGPLNYYQTPNTRWTAGAFVNYELNSHATAYMNFMYTRNDSQAQIAPSGDFGQPSFIPCADPLLTAQEVAVLCAPAVLAANGNPTETYNGVTYPGVNMVILRRNVEGGDRIAAFTTNATREVLGIKGDFADAWSYNAYAQHGNVENQNANLNYLGNNLVQQALNVLPNATAGGAPVCGGPTATSSPLITGNAGFTVNKNCAPWNIWVPNGVTPQALQFMSLPLLLDGNVEEYVVDGSVTGDLGHYGLQTPWADQGLQVNVGAEWRSEFSNFAPDYEEQNAQAGGGGGAVKPINGEFNVKEGFTELRLPIVTHATGAEDLSFEGGYRYSKYSENFNTNTYKLGLEWAPVRDVRLRASYQRAVRAPNIGELFPPQAVLLDGSIDPCAGAAPSASLAACQASGMTAAQYGHVPANVARQYNGLIGGNPSLTPEIADTYTYGIVFTPQFLKNFTLSADYFDIKIKNVIGIIGGNTIINDCLSSLSPRFCDLVHRDSSGSLWKSVNGYIIDTTVNEGELSTKGIDVKASYRQPLPQYGSLMFSLEGTKLLHLTTTPVVGFGSYDCVGLYGVTCGGANPKWRHVMNIAWNTPWDGLDVNLRWRYIGSDQSEQLSSSTFLHGNAYFNGFSVFPAFNYVDLAGTFNLLKNVRMTLGVNNIADKAPPLATGGDCSTSSPAGANCNGNTFPGVYDALGRYVFVQVSAQF